MLLKEVQLRCMSCVKSLKSAFCFLYGWSYVLSCAVADATVAAATTDGEVEHEYPMLRLHVRLRCAVCGSPSPSDCYSGFTRQLLLHISDVKEPVHCRVAQDATGAPAVPVRARIYDRIVFT